MCSPSTLQKGQESPFPTTPPHGPTQQLPHSPIPGPNPHQERTQPGAVLMGTGPVMGEQAGALKLRARRRVSCIPRGSSPPPRKARPPHLEGDVHQHQALHGAGSSPGARCEQRGEGAQLLSCLHGSTHHGGTKPRTFASSGVQVCIPNRPSLVLSERQRKEQSCCLPPPTSALLESSEPLSPSSWPCSGQI